MLRYQLGDPAPYLYRTADYGESWTRLTTGENGIPADHPTRVIREDPEREGLLYAGTEYGVYVSFDDGAHWQSLQADLPVTPVTDIKVHRGDLALSTMGRGFWIMDDLSPLRQLSPEVARAAIHLFEPADAYRMRYFAFRRSPADPEYRPVGAFIDYHLAEDVEGVMTLEIVDDRGEVIRRYSSADGETEEESGGSPWRGGGRRESLPTSAGMHRFLWDLRHPGPWQPGDRGGWGGPLVSPGRYEARLQVAGQTLTRTVRVLIDPRVAADGVDPADLLAQERLNLRIRDVLSEARRTAQRVEELQATLRERAKEAGQGEGEEAPTGGDFDAAARELETLHRALVSDRDVRYPETMLIDQLEYLYGMTSSADQRPGEDAYRRIETLEAELDTLTDRLERLTRERLPALGIAAESEGNR